MLTSRLYAGYGLVIADECHHVPAAAFEHAVRQIPARRWLGLTATPYRRYKLDDLIWLQVGPVRHTITHPTASPGPEQRVSGQPGLDLDLREVNPRPAPVIRVHLTQFCYAGAADPSAPGGMALIYKELIADSDRTAQVAADVAEALARDRNCLVLTQWTSHIDQLAAALRDNGPDPVILRGGMGARARAAAIARLHASPGEPPLLVIATGPYIGEGFDCPALDTLFLAAPVASKARLVQYAGRILRARPGKATAEIHDYHDARTQVLASSLAKRAPGYTSLGFPTHATSSPLPAPPTPRRLAPGPASP
jgi:superfamily II DNA or RNA helicase